MLVMTAKLTRRKIVFWFLMFGLLLCGAIMLFAGSDASTQAGSFPRAKTNAERVEILESYGWKAEPEPLEFMEIRIPEEFDEVYSKYNETQLAQGFDLKKYSGKRVMRYAYRITNYPSNQSDVIANLMFFNDRLIGGDISSQELDGFTHGLKMPE